MDQDSKALEALVAHLEELTEEIEENHTPEFLAHLNHSAPEVRAVAVRGLWESRDPDEVLEPLWQVAEQDENEEVRATAISVMGRYIYEGLLMGDGQDGLAEDEVNPQSIARVRTFLEGILHDEQQSELLRRRALEALAFDPGPEEVVLMEKWGKDPSSTLRMTAVFAMGRSGLEQWEKPVLKALEDSSYEVRREAIRATGEAGFESGVSKVARFIKGDDRELKMEAISALGFVGGEEAIDILTDLVDDEDEEIAELAQAALEAAEEQVDFDDFEDFDGEDEDPEES